MRLLLSVCRCAIHLPRLLHFHTGTRSFIYVVLVVCNPSQALAYLELDLK